MTCWVSPKEFAKETSLHRSVIRDPVWKVSFNIVPDNDQNSKCLLAVKKHQAHTEYFMSREIPIIEIGSAGNPNRAPSKIISPYNNHISSSKATRMIKYISSSKYATYTQDAYARYLAFLSKYGTFRTRKDNEFPENPRITYLREKLRADAGLYYFSNFKDSIVKSGFEDPICKAEIENKSILSCELSIHSTKRFWETAGEQVELLVPSISHEICFGISYSSKEVIDSNGNRRKGMDISRNGSKGTMEIFSNPYKFSGGNPNIKLDNANAELLGEFGKETLCSISNAVAMAVAPGLGKMVGKLFATVLVECSKNIVDAAGKAAIDSYVPNKSDDAGAQLHCTILIHGTKPNELSSSIESILWRTELRNDKQPMQLIGNQTIEVGSTIHIKTNISAATMATTKRFDACWGEIKGSIDLSNFENSIRVF